MEMMLNIQTTSLQHNFWNYVDLPHHSFTLMDGMPLSLLCCGLVVKVALPYFFMNYMKFAEETM